MKASAIPPNMLQNSEERRAQARKTLQPIFEHLRRNLNNEVPQRTYWASWMIELIGELKRGMSLAAYEDMLFELRDWIQEYIDAVEAES